MKNKTMKIIDLFNDIANNKKVPEKIKVGEDIYYFDIDESSYTRYIDNDEDYPRGLLEDIDLHNSYVWFNLIVEILEDKHNNIDPLNPISLEEFKGMNPSERYHATMVEYDKIEELRIAINYLLEKSE